MSRADPPPEAAVRIDKWLWYARFFKSRSQASRLCAAGKVRVNRKLVKKAHYPLKPGDVLTFPQGARIRAVRVDELGSRRGPAAEARTLYEDLAPCAPLLPKAGPGRGPGLRARGAGRPTKAERRAIDRLIREG